MKRNSSRLVAAALAGALIIASCGGDDSSSSTDTPSSEAPSTDAPSSEAPSTDAPSSEAPTTDAPAAAWAANTDDCADPDAANAPISGTVKVGGVLPLSGGTAALAFAPVRDGMEAYVKYANEKKILGDITIELTIEDDQYNPDLTPGAVDKLLDAEVNLITGIVGTPGNLAVRDTLNEECVPQVLSLSGDPQFGDAEEYPWTSGALVPYDVESKAYAKTIRELYPDGATVALYTVNSDFGAAYVEAFKEIAGEADSGIEIVDEQTIDAAASEPPTAQLNAIATSAPDVILAVPLGAQCPTFLSTLAEVKAANAGWEPKLFLTATCASSLILTVAGASADGLYTSNNLVDINNPDYSGLPSVKEYIDYMTAEGKLDVATTAGAGWTVMETTVEILRLAAESPEGLTRASIMNAARSYAYSPMLARPGVVLAMNGLDDTHQAESLQVIQYNATTKIFSDVSDVITEFES
jgi:branched-chain amino acid transport system substrate-binding protein